MLSNAIVWIFLDIDGVLVPDTMYERTDLPPFDPADPPFEPACRDRFETVLRHHRSALVVIASSWREIFPLSAICDRFSPDIARRVVGQTPFLAATDAANVNHLRHREVEAFLAGLGVPKAPWVAIDDIADHFRPGAPVILTDGNVGFDDRAAAALDQALYEV
ncbi:MAG: hypothetical protein Fur0042_27160 [Cyanophyceae cyanobacterium]